jgi:hypothetical protein
MGDVIAESDMRRSIFAILAIIPFSNIYAEEGSVQTKNGRMECSISHDKRPVVVTVTWRSKSKAKAIITRTNLFQGARAGTMDDVRIFPRGAVLEDTDRLIQRVKITSKKWYNVTAISIGFIEEGDDLHVYSCNVQFGKVDESALTQKLDEVQKRFSKSSLPECVSIANRIAALQGPPAAPGATQAGKSTLCSACGGAVDISLLQDGAARQRMLVGLITEAEALKQCWSG